MSTKKGLATPQKWHVCMLALVSLVIALGSGCVTTGQIARLERNVDSIGRKVDVNTQNIYKMGKAVDKLVAWGDGVNQKFARVESGMSDLGKKIAAISSSTAPSNPTTAGSTGAVCPVGHEVRYYKCSYAWLRRCVLTATLASWSPCPAPPPCAAHAKKSRTWHYCFTVKANTFSAVKTELSEKAAGCMYHSYGWHAPTKTARACVRCISWGVSLRVRDVLKYCPSCS